MNRPLALASSVAGAVVVALDGTVLTVAQPTLQRDLHASFAQVQWTSTGYLVAVASLLVFAGRLGDRYGHRHMFAVGMLGFGAASAGIALAPEVGWVIGLRVVQGVFGALLQPATLGMLRVAYPPERLRRPLAARTAAIGVAAAAGPLVGGALATGFGWRAVFLLNIAPALGFGVLALTAGEQGEQRERERPRAAGALDVPGALLLAVALACLVHTLVTPLGVTGALGAAVALAAVLAGAAFVRHERRTPAPLLPRMGAPPARAQPRVGEIGSPAVGAALALLVTASAALNGALFACVYVLQDDLGLTPLRTALLSLPLAVLLIAAAPASAVLLRRAGARPTLAGATAVLATGLLVLAQASGTTAFCTGFALLGAGFGTVMVAATHVVVRQAPAESAGVAGGWQQTAMNVGPVLGVASATVLMGHAGTRSPLLVLAGAAVAAVPVCRLLPGRSGPGATASSAGLPAGGSDTEHTVHGVERNPFPPSLRDHEV
ncbi:MFS transporter [Streptomyces aurantiogriseus]|uniref:MFS transporter n=1 Tax=Streptomyces aurantiogriseus TaxID=66870 RepID=A0A918BXM1_9ACTN|nr:MFS transporter [Streptomyces aurantiogriseus]GGQ97270.1 MFS transporter [Streptomyces aurantiogriseus]